MPADLTDTTFEDVWHGMAACGRGTGRGPGLAARGVSGQGGEVASPGHPPTRQAGAVHVQLRNNAAHSAAAHPMAGQRHALCPLHWHQADLCKIVTAGRAVFVERAALADAVVSCKQSQRRRASDVVRGRQGGGAAMPPRRWHTHGSSVQYTAALTDGRSGNQHLWPLSLGRCLHGVLNAHTRQRQAARPPALSQLLPMGREKDTLAARQQQPRASLSSMYDC
jgi:hypothetical protein